MITLTDEARRHVQRLLETEGKPAGGLRIALRPGEGGGEASDVDLQVADGPAATDTTVDAGGVRLFLDSRAARALRGGQILVEAGALVLDLPEAASPAAAPAQCGGRVLPANTAFEPANAADGVEAGHRRRRPLWLVVALTVVTGGTIYPLVWLGITWAEMKRELEDDTMHPWGHALSQVVPIYGLFRFHDHYVVIDELLRRAGTPATVQPTLALIAWIVGGGLSRVSARLDDNFMPAVVLDLAGTALVAWAMVHGQRGLNAYWNATASGPAPWRAHWAEWLLLALGVISLILILGVILLGIALGTAAE